MTEERDDHAAHQGGGTTIKLIVSYVIVGVPLLYGLLATAAKAAQLFTR